MLIKTVVTQQFISLDHVVVMQHVTKEKIDIFVNALKAGL